VIGDGLKELLETKDLSESDIEKRTGWLRCFISRVEVKGSKIFYFSA
jgi:hypothetical protein